MAFASSASSRTRALARLATLRRACALGGVSLAVLAPSAHAQTARPAGEAYAAARGASMPPPTFAAGVPNPFGIGTPVSSDINKRPVLTDLDGDGDVDLLVGRNDGTFAYYQNTAGPGVTPAYAPVQANPFGLTDTDPSLASEQNAPTVGDIDGDGDLDVLSGNKSGNLIYFENTAGPSATPTFAARAVNPFGLTDVGITPNTNDYAKPAIQDLDGDGDMDVLVGRDDGQFTYFQNTAGPQATPTFVRATTPAGLSDIGRGASPAVGDLDGDGDLDVLSGETYGTFFYFQNTAGPRATPVFAEVQVNPGGLSDIGNNSAPTLGDADGDGDLDVFAGDNASNGNASNLTYFQNTAGPGGITARLTGTTGYRQLAAPTATPFNDVLGAGIFTQSIPGADDASGASPNVFLYDETNAGTLNDGFVVPATLAAPLGAGRGAFVYVFEDEDPRPSAPDVQGGFPKTLTATGRPALVDFDWGAGGDAALSFTDTGAALDDGWNLLGNPFGSWFDWDAVDLAGVNAPVYVYDNVTANYLSHSRGIPNAGGLAGGIVGPFQGFWVQTNAASPSITARAVVSNGGPLYRGADAAPTVVGLRVRPGDGSALPAGVQSEAFLALGVAGAHDEVSGLDAYALTPPAQSYVLLATRAASTDGLTAGLAIDARPASTTPVTVELDVAQVVGGTPAGGALVLDWPGLALPEGWTARLLDRETGTVVDLTDGGQYPFTLDGPAAVAPTSALTIPALAGGPRVAAESLTAGRFALVVTPRGATAGEATGTQTLALSAARPNPTTGAATLVLTLPAASDVRVAVYDVLGRQVALLAEGQFGAGETTVRVAPGALAAGTYVVRATVGARTLTQRLTVTR